MGWLESTVIYSKSYNKNVHNRRVCCFFSFAIGNFFLMERFGIQNQTLVSFLLVLFIFISYNCFVSSQNDDVNEVSVSEQERVRVRVGMVLNLGSLEGTIVETSVSLALSDFYAVNSDYKTRVSLSVRNSQGEPLLALASGNSDYYKF